MWALLILAQASLLGLTALSSAVPAQGTQPRPPAQGNPPSPRRPPGTDQPSQSDQKDFGSIEAEMIERANLSNRDEEQKRVVKAAEDIHRWSQELSATKQEKPGRPRDDARQLLNDMEKAARRIRSIYGTGAMIEQLDDPPESWAEGVKEIESTAAQLLDDVKKTRRQVISVPVIANADKIALLSRWLRETSRASP